MTFVSELAAWGIKRRSIYPSSSFGLFFIGPGWLHKRYFPVFSGEASVRPQCSLWVGAGVMLGDVNIFTEVIEACLDLVAAAEAWPRGRATRICSRTQMPYTDTF